MTGGYMFKRKVYNELLEWKEKYADRSACLLKGARRVGKSTIALEFAKNEYESFIFIDFSNISTELLEVFNDISDLDIFFLRLQTVTGINLIVSKSAIIFDEVQFFPKARQAIKHLVKDARYHYIETGSLISIKKNVQDILIPSEEHKINVFPMDYEEFNWALGKSTDSIRTLVEKNVAIGDMTNRKLMRDFRIYMAVGGMPQVVSTYLQTNNLDAVDKEKLDIISLYEDDLKKIDPSGRLSDIYASIPSQLALKRNRFKIAEATKSRRQIKDEERLFDLIDSKIVLPCYNVAQPSIALAQTRDPETFKLYISDIGLFTTMIFDGGKGLSSDIYKKLLSDKLSADLGYMYENAIAQIIVNSGNNLYYHSWRKENSTHSNEIDFLICSKNKIIPIEVKSSATKSHISMDEFCKKYSHEVGRRFLFSQKDFSKDGMLELKPIYAVPFLLENL